MDMNINKQKPIIDELKLIVDNELCCAYGQSGIGGRKENQDTYGGIGTNDVIILTVCDGMGGMAGGQIASNIAVKEILRYLSSLSTDKMGLDEVRNAVYSANEAIYKYSIETPKLRGMGTTAIVVVIMKDAAYLAHVGDSRIYLIRKGRKIFRTFDHSRVFEMVKQGLMSEEQARQSAFSNIITRALGIKPNVDVEVERLPYKKDDRFILCCDGIWNIDPEQDMLKLFAANGKTHDVITNITETVNDKGIERGGEYDNLTIIMADMKKNSTFQYGFFHSVRERIASYYKLNIRKNVKKNNP